MLGDSHSAVLSRLMDVASLRQRVHAANLANQNTPGYRAKAVAFEGALREALDAGGDPGSVEPTIFEPRSTPVQNDGNDVDPDHEVMASAQNALLYNTYVSLVRGENKLLTTAVSSAP
jgi:flagellar basal-body rod protein FlgB